ncbi:hybrid sensor histidine kinase/response regulator [Desulfopila aestuarii]|uniref:histidine kinase n=1 Tax=Desulfopila aestuarii DSM 18488 TaxID=1121416 RepID=A0A1M7YDY7_9BACT|nr:response regulator [Desulfopila aestuarii]SHO50845.1 PAS domain S-box-containing protein [Desulfopila aestuarii DSM 18488]
MLQQLLTKIFPRYTTTAQVESINLLLNNTPTAAAVNSAIAILTWMAIPSPSALWLSLILIASLLRFLPIFISRKMVLTDNLQRLHTLILLTIFVQGVAWGYTSTQLFSTTSEHQSFFLLTIICGMMGGAILTLAPSLLGFLCFILPSGCPLIIIMFMSGQSTFQYAACMGIIFIVALILLTRKICQNHLELILSKQQLEETSAELVNHQKHLENLVKERTIELQASRESYRRLIEEINDVIYELDVNGIIRYISPAVTPLLGYPADQLLGRPLKDFIAPEDREKVQANFDATLAGELTPLDYRILDTSGKTRWLRTSNRPVVEDGHPAGLRGVLTSIDMEKLAEQEKLELVRKIGETQKLEALGTLAGGVAHDFNNLLMGIQGRTSLIAMHLPPSDPAQEHTRAIDEYIRSASSLTSQLLGTARGGKYDPKPTDLNKLVERSVKLFGRTRKEISLELQLSPTAAIANIDTPQIEQVLLNMFVNGWQAMPDGGALSVKVSHAMLDAAFCAPYNIAPGKYLRISVADTGIGMDDTVRARIFDPFFTTKELGRGTGLGLASAHGIISNHQGCITVQSQPGKGTNFDIYLPALIEITQQQTMEETRIDQGVETILLVDDEEMIVEVGEAVLKKLGYRVLVARGGRQAIGLLEEYGDDIDLVLLDMIMPGMDGGKTFDALRALSPNLLIILSSGYAMSDEAMEIMQRGCNGFIQKPYNLSELSQKIRNVLDTRP